MSRAAPVTIREGSRAMPKAQLVDFALYMAASAEKASSPALREARLAASRGYATEAIRSCPPPARTWGTGR